MSYIDKEEAIKRLCNERCGAHHIMCDGRRMMCDKIRILHDMASVEIIRCKDCREYNVKKGVCGYANYYPSPDDYCSRAVRWEDNG